MILPFIRLTAIEKGNSSSSNSESIGTAVQAYQIKVLQKLKTIRESLIEEIGDVAKIKLEHQSATSENIELKKEVERLKYRVHILIKSLNDEEAKNANTK